MLATKIIRLCAVLVLGGISISFATNADAYYLYRDQAFNLIDENGHVEVPDTVVQIGSKAFANSAIRSISIPDTVTHIQSGAFQNTPLLKEIILPDSIIHIGEEAFRGSAIEKINFPEGLQEIERWAFAHTNLTNVTLPNSISTFNSPRIPPLYTPISSTFKLIFIIFTLLTLLTGLNKPVQLVCSLVILKLLPSISKLSKMGIES